ncbi:MULTISPECIES: DUF4153 domain-containing protein [unclassified Fusibacter]|uniref:DUF4153 domain-containing protein n=1 Tax=unclassified Fusibacter TaxID=2624464 RepID=UPI00101371D3|nr:MULTISPECIES: DUF4153 domain-containing protein [unclassified Fusibacter]MCK8059321.1 DUF4153 domain-containing protein [Fusibacter sp. A2]NPE21215.1 DUF4153 domain-containing protein [Fusibacter sp. A1]RXV62483.1 DUF4153 domain-containing protein [Fusibacter sp. A1]
MIIKLKTWFITAFKTLKHSIERYPEALLLAYAFGVTAILMNHASYTQTDYRNMLEHLLLTFSLGVPMLLSVKMLHESYFKKNWHRIAMDVFAGVLLILFYLTIPKEINDIFALRVFVVNVSLYLSFTLIPFFYQKRGYALYVLKLIADFAVTFLYSLVLFLGLAAIYFALEELFGIDIKSDLYSDTFVVVATGFAPTYFLGGLIRSAQEIENFSYSNVFKILFVYIVMPILSIYTGILYAYFIKLMIGMTLPENIIGNLVIWYSGITLVVLFFTSGQKDANAFSKLFHKYMPIAILLPLAMMFYAMFIRIDAYGLTVKRYFVVALGIWVLGNMIYLIVSKKKVNQVIVMTAVIVMLLTMYGPLGAYPMSIWQQNARFEKALTEYGMLTDSVIIARTDLTEEQERVVIDAIHYFSWQHELSDLKLLPEGFETSDTKEVFGFEYDGYGYPRFQEEYFSYWSDNEQMDMDIEGYTRLVRINWYDGVQNKLGVHLIENEAGDFDVYDKDVYLTNLPIIKWIEGRENRDAMVSADDATIVFEENGKTYKAIVQNINGEMNGDRTTISIKNMNLILLIE